jgi:hypothetical protein
MGDPADNPKTVWVTDGIQKTLLYKGSQLKNIATKGGFTNLGNHHRYDKP